MFLNRLIILQQQVKGKLHRLLWPVLLVLLAACSNIPTPAERLLAAEQQVRDKHFLPRVINTRTFALQAYYRFSPPKDDANLTIFIEGDGYAWASSSQPSFDPTPVEPVALEMALNSAAGNVAYIGRPCQYIKALNGKLCTMSEWTHRRFSAQAVAALDEAVDALKRESGAAHIRLVGFSGGGAMAALVAARRHDVQQLVTVAGNLDPARWVQIHRISALEGSLNPVDFAAQLEHIPQHHFVGAEDDNITVAIAQSYQAAFANKDNVKIVVVPEFTHLCCWAAEWPRLEASLGD